MAVDLAVETDAKVRTEAILIAATHCVAIQTAAIPTEALVVTRNVAILNVVTHSVTADSPNVVLIVVQGVVRHVVGPGAASRFAVPVVAPAAGIQCAETRCVQFAVSQCAETQCVQFAVSQSAEIRCVQFAVYQRVATLDAMAVLRVEEYQKVLPNGVQHGVPVVRQALNEVQSVAGVAQVPDVFPVLVPPPVR